MSWGKGLDEILKTVDCAIFDLTYDPQGRNIAPEGIDVILAWAGNDVYAEWGYLGFTWHNKQKWVKGLDELQRQAATRTPKHKAKVEEAIERLKIVANLPVVKSVVGVVPIITNCPIFLRELYVYMCIYRYIHYVRPENSVTRTATRTVLQDHARVSAYGPCTGVKIAYGIRAQLHGSCCP